MDPLRGGKCHTAQINIVQIQTSLSDVSYGNSAIVITICTRSVSNNAYDIEQENAHNTIRSHARLGV